MNFAVAWSVSSRAGSRQVVMRILADENIPYVFEAFGHYGQIRLRPGRAIAPEDVRDADVLLVRSVTPVNARLLDGSSVRFVGSATIGTDHVDHAYLRSRNIAFAHAPGSNAESVVEYVLAALHRLAVRRNVRLRDLTVGIVGCGRVGGQLADRLPAVGVRVLKNDPPRAEQAERRGDRHDFVSLDDLLPAADAVTLHVPLTQEGAHKTVHLFDDVRLRRMKPGAWLINTARGPVVSGEALKRVLEEGHLGAAALDVWEGEPVPDPELIRLVDLATPHIAGYSYDGKVCGTVMLYQAFVRHFGFSECWDWKAVLKTEGGASHVPRTPERRLPETRWFDRLIRTMYDVEADDTRFREILALTPAERGDYFAYLRKHYPCRRSFSSYSLVLRHVPKAYRTGVEDGLKVRLT